MPAKLARSIPRSAFSLRLPALLVVAGCTGSPASPPGSTPAPAMSGAAASGGVPVMGAAGGVAAGGSAAGAVAAGGASAGASRGGTATAGSGIGGGTGGELNMPQGPFQVLAFTKTTDFRHDSIGAGLDLLSQLGAEHDFTVKPTEDSAEFTDDNLAQYAVVVFMNTSGELLDETQQGAFERYIRAGGGFVGVHCASCAERDWAWYGELVGARFSNHPAIQKLTIHVETHEHPSTAGLPDVWVRDEEPYNFETNPRANVTVLATFDESTYEGGTMGDDHPISWCHEFDGGRAWYTGLGHINEGYTEESFVQHLLGGITWAAGRAP